MLAPVDLTDSGIIILKFWVHISEDEQLRRFEARSQTPYKAWKLTEEDWQNRENWELYEEAVSEMLVRTSTLKAPWIVVAGNDKYYARVKVLKQLVQALGDGLHGENENSKGHGKIQVAKGGLTCYVLQRHPSQALLHTVAIRRYLTGRQDALELQVEIETTYLQHVSQQ